MLSFYTSSTFFAVGLLVSALLSRKFYALSVVAPCSQALRAQNLR
jgi:hypothetical protein